MDQNWKRKAALAAGLSAAAAGIGFEIGRSSRPSPGEEADRSTQVVKDEPADEAQPPADALAVSEQTADEGKEERPRVAATAPDTAPGLTAEQVMRELRDPNLEADDYALVLTAYFRRRFSDLDSITFDPATALFVVKKQNQEPPVSFFVFSQRGDAEVFWCQNSADVGALPETVRGLPGLEEYIGKSLAR
ncbi:MAG: hypothetical protein HYV42_02635 [Candidatus Magasanikbacteria bacterium]|nr:hypothetical protein [Candidatus Magasanikbacteria bacterium]